MRIFMFFLEMGLGGGQRLDFRMAHVQKDTYGPVIKHSSNIASRRHNSKAELLNDFF